MVLHSGSAMAPTTPIWNPYSGRYAHDTTQSYVLTHTKKIWERGREAAGELAFIYLWTLAAGSWQIQCGPRHAGCCRHSCSSVLPGYTLGTVSHSPTRTPRCLLGSPQRRTHRGPKGKDQQHQHRHSYTEPCSWRRGRGGLLLEPKHKHHVCWSTRKQLLVNKHVQDAPCFSEQDGRTPQG